ncbi:hypothetical protein M422DRAFT_30732 [Sphaerobolus stellatus SS14]|uniref:N-acetyltransferase domain-containing protein n=1 Tax=Sphaerobolus stellatus (strain SS14) TaxID=990650 RepID=A0A0C9VPC6_SPHS4|nr:hypothetical protein M422DRAFT_30732 [Sphaerobolus stellatus SS14]
MIDIKQIDKSYLPIYDTIPMLVRVESEYAVEPIDGGLGGFLFQLKEVTTPYTKDLGKYEKPSKYEERFDISNWAFFIAFDTDKPNPDGSGPLAVGAITLVGRTPNVDMLDRRDDLAVLWDIRVREESQRLGLGTKLFTTAVRWARKQGFRQLKIEAQNNNIAACRFYRKQGALLGGLNRYAYYDDPDIRGDVQLLWYLDL